MMNLKEFATLSNCSLPKIKQYAQSTFGHIPDTLDDDQIAQLSDLIARDTKALTSAGDTSKEETAGELAATGSKAPSNLELAKTFGKYLEQLKLEFLTNQFEIEKIQFQLEQQFYAKLQMHQLTVHQESRSRISKNLQLWRGELATDADDENPEKSAIYTDIADLMAFFR